MASRSRHALVDLDFHLAAPPTSSGREYAGLALHVRVSSFHVLLGGAIAIGIVWLATEGRRSHRPSTADRAPSELPRQPLASASPGANR